MVHFLCTSSEDLSGVSRCHAPRSEENFELLCQLVKFLSFHHAEKMSNREEEQPQANLMIRWVVILFCLGLPKCSNQGEPSHPIFPALYFRFG